MITLTNLRNDILHIFVKFIVVHIAVGIDLHFVSLFMFISLVYVHFSF